MKGQLPATPLLLAFLLAMPEGLPHHAGHAERAQQSSPLLSLCKCLQVTGSSDQVLCSQAKPHTALPQGPQSQVYLQLHWREEKSEDIYTTASTAEPLCHSQRRGPTPQAGIEHQETVHMTLKHRQDKVQFLKGRFI